VSAIGLEAKTGVRVLIVLDLEPDFGRVVFGLPNQVELEVPMMPLNPPLSLPIPMKLKNQQLAD
jgi:hypothetical protein